MDGLAERFAEHRREMARRKTERERTKNSVEKEDFLLNQIDEFREKAKQLQSLLISRESKAQELQEIVEEREGKAKELSDIIDEHQDAADRVVAGVGTQIDGMVEKIDAQIGGMIQKVDAKLNELNETFAERLAENAVNSSDQTEETRKLIGEQREQLSETISGLDGQLDKIKNEIFEKVHTENVKCYRNMQTLFEEADQKTEELKEQVGGILSLKKVFYITAACSVLNLVGLAAFIIYALGIV